MRVTQFLLTGAAFGLLAWQPSLGLGTAGMPASLSAFQEYTEGLLCIRDEFVRTHSTLSSRTCSAECSGNSNCHGYANARSSCQLFIRSEISRTTPYCKDGDKLLLYTIEANIGLKAYETYQNEQTYSVPLDGSMPRIYRSGILDHLGNFAAKGRWQIVVEMRTNDRTVAQAVFRADPDGLDKNSWFSAPRLLYTRPYWFGRSNFNIFSIAGDARPDLRRRFQINRSYSSCSTDIGLFVVSDLRDTCPWGQGGPDKPPTLIYSMLDGVPYQQNNSAYADRFLIYLQTERSMPSPYAAKRRNSEDFHVIEGDKLLLFTVKANSGHQAADTFLNRKPGLSTATPGVMPDAYRSDWIDSLSQAVTVSGKQFLIAEMRVGNRMVAQVVFDVSIDRSSLDKLNWFAQSRVVTSHPYAITNLKFVDFTLPSNVHMRGFRMFFSYNGCPNDRAFWVVSDARDPCPWGSSGWRGSPPVLVFTETPSEPSLQSGGAKFADRLLIYLK